MAYSKFTLKSVKAQFGLVENNEPFTKPFQAIQPSQWLLQTLEIGMEGALFSEKSRSENIVSPIIREIKQYFPKKIGVYSGATLDPDQSLGLSGECDFVLSLGIQTLDLEAPVFCLIEAKDNDIELGVAQCVEQMIGARLFNRNEGREIPVIYGCSTTGEDWLFLRLENNEIMIDARRYSLYKLDELLGALHGIVKEAIGQA